MSLSEQFAEAIKNKDVQMTRTCITNLLADGNQVELFDQFRSQAESTFGAELYEVNRQAQPNLAEVTDKSATLKDQIAKLLINFAQDRLNFVVALMTSMGYTLTTNSRNTDVSHREPERVIASREEVTNHGLNKLGMAVTAAGVVVAGAGIVAANTAVAVVGGVAAVGGAVYTVAKK